MNRRGVCYDVGAVTDINWRPDFDPRIIRRELEIIRDDLHCNAVRITARSLGRLEIAARDALALGLEVWLHPVLWDKGPDATLGYMVRGAELAERLRAEFPDRLVYVLGGELTLFMQGILPGRNIVARVRGPAFRESVRAGTHNAPLNSFLRRAAEAVRPMYHGPLTYASLIFETVDWGLFDIVGVDHYRGGPVKDHYVEMLDPLFATGKPVVITEFGTASCQGGDAAMATSIAGNIDPRSWLLHRLPLVGRFVRPRVRRVVPRDEAFQARELSETLVIQDAAGVDGAFVSTFLFPIKPYDDDPRFDLDAESTALAKTYTRGRHGTSYPDMAWEPKQAFEAVAHYYERAGHAEQPEPAQRLPGFGG
jgi:hypothetical protein